MRASKKPSSRFLLKPMVRLLLPERRRANQIAVALEQQLLPGLSWRLLQQKQLAARLDRNHPGMFFPERHTLAEIHRLGEEFGLLEGETGIGAGIKKRPYAGPAEHRDGPVHGDHRDVRKGFDGKILCRTTGCNDENRALLNIPATCEPRYRARRRRRRYYFHVLCPNHQATLIIMGGLGGASRRGKDRLSPIDRNAV